MNKLLLFIAFLLVGIAASAQFAFEKIYVTGRNDYGWNACQTLDGGYLACGYAHNVGYSHNILLIRTNVFGDTLWTRIITNTNHAEGMDVLATADSGFVITGLSIDYALDIHDVCLIKVSATGATLWTKNYGGIGVDVGLKLTPTFDGGYAIAGYTHRSSPTDYECYLIKTDAFGDTLWTKTYGGLGDQSALSITQTSDSGYILCGRNAISSTAQRDIYLVRTNAHGDTLWTRTYGGIMDDEAYSVAQTQDGGFVVGGYTNSTPDSTSDVMLLRINANGDSLWGRTYGGAYSDYGSALVSTADGGFAIAGTTFTGNNNGSIYLIRTDAVGDTLWTRSFEGTSPGIDHHSLRLASDGGFLMAGTSYHLGGAYACLIKTDADGKLNMHYAFGSSNPIIPYPNPTAGLLRFIIHPMFGNITSLELFDAFARSLATTSGTTELDLTQHPAGLYFVRITFENGESRSVKVVKE